LYQAGLTNTVAYSVYLGSTDDASGQLLFGGIDTAKYSGELSTMELFRDSAGNEQLLVAMTGISLDDGTGPQSFPTFETYPVLLDSGTSMLQVPTEAYDSLIKALGAEYYSDRKTYYVPCSQRDGNVSLTYSFGSVDIEISAENLIFPFGYDTFVFQSLGNNVTFEGEEFCLPNFRALTTADESQGFFVLGAPFFQSAYMVFDLHKGKVSMAQKLETTESNIVEIQVDANGDAIIPSAAVATFTSSIPSTFGAGVTYTNEANLPTQSVDPSLSLPTFTASGGTSDGASATGTSTAGTASATHKSSASRMVVGASSASYAKAFCAVVLAFVGGAFYVI
jgi:hypothetical protein